MQSAFTENGNTPLMWACFRGQLDIVQELLHADVDQRAKNKAGSAALDIAGKLRMIDIIRCIEEHGRRPKGKS